MKALFIACFLFLADKDLLFYREILVQSEKNAEITQVFYDRSRKLDDASRPVLLGYKAMASFMMSKHGSNPVKKLGHFSDGRKQLEQAIQRDTANAELLYLRFSVQSNLPAFLGYGSDQEKDKARLLLFLQKNNSVDKDLKDRIFNFILHSARLTAAEKKQLEHG